MKRVLSLLVVLMVSIMSFGQYIVNVYIDNNPPVKLKTVFDNTNTHQITNDYTDSNTIYIEQGSKLKITVTDNGNQGGLLIYNNVSNMIYSADTAFIQHTATIYSDIFPHGEYLLNVQTGGVVFNNYQFLKIVVGNETLNNDEYGFDRTEMRVFPSPATTSTTVRFFADKSDVSVQVFSLNGTLVFADDKTRNVGSMNDVVVPLSNFAAGVYIARAGDETFKFVKL